MNYEFDTITALATPLGVSGVAIIRISGEKSFEIAGKIFKGKIESGKICFGKIIDNEQVIDEVVILPFKNPHSFTGEDVVEIQCHGGLRVIENIMDLVLKNGARQAEKGEFTKRAFLNKKMDLSQAEAVLDIIHSQTSIFAKKNANNLTGALSKYISELRQNLLNIMSKIIAGIDFPEDVKEPEYSELETVVSDTIKKIEKILNSAKSSNIMRQGLKIAIVGKPNVGKSSLFNTLLSQNRAIVTEIAGTTRDTIQEVIDISGIPVTIIDTAGIRENKNIDIVEQIGIEGAKNVIDQADLILFLYSSTQKMDKDDLKIFELIKNKPYIKIATKSDIGNIIEENSIKISSSTGENIDILKEKIKSKIFENNEIENTEYVTNQRQQSCLEQAKTSLMIALSAIQEKELQDLISIDIKDALLALDELSGEVVTDNILNNIFENFCIGK